MTASFQKRGGLAP